MTAHDDTIASARATLAALAADAGEPGSGKIHLRIEPHTLDDGGQAEVAHIVLDHPEARSAMTLSMMVDLADAVIALRDWPGAVVVLSSNDPRAFCSGGHLGQVTRAVSGADRAVSMCRAMTAVLDGLGELPQLSVAAIHGLAVGGGAELVTATDLRVADPEARIQFVHTRLGIVPGWGGTARLVRIVGRRAALDLLARARPLFPGEASRIGLVDHRCDGAAVDAALRWLGDAVAAPAEVLRAMKRQVTAAERGDRATDAEAFASVWGGPAHLRALAGLERHRR